MDEHDHIIMAADGFHGRAQRILLDLEFADAAPLPAFAVDSEMVTIEATAEGTVYALTIAPGDPLFDLIAVPELASEDV